MTNPFLVFPLLTGLIISGSLSLRTESPFSSKGYGVRGSSSHPTPSSSSRQHHPPPPPITSSTTPSDDLFSSGGTRFDPDAETDLDDEETFNPHHHYRHHEPHHGLSSPSSPAQRIPSGSNIGTSGDGSSVPSLSSDTSPDDDQQGQPGEELNSFGFCESYRGSVCSQFIGNQSIFVQSRRSQDLIEEKLSAAFTVVATSHDVSPQCHRFAIPSLCFAAFPLCDEYSHEPRPRKVCRDECEMLETSICRMEYAIAKKHPLIGQQNNLLPTCEDLPPAGSKDSANCLRLGVPNVVHVVHEHTCYTGKGKEYRGTASRTQSGLECGPWNRQVFYRTADYPEIIGGHNFCRNPGGMEAQPWCFVYEKDGSKQPCDVPKCIDHFWLYIVAPGVGAFSLFFLLICICCLRRKKRTKSGPTTAHHIPVNRSVNSPTASLTSSGIRRTGSNPNSHMEQNALLHRQNQNRSLNSTDYSMSSMRFLDDWGENTFGKVYRGELVMPQGETIPIAIKPLSDAGSARYDVPSVPSWHKPTRPEFHSMRDADRIREHFSHPNEYCNPLEPPFEMSSGRRLTSTPTRYSNH